MHYLENLKLGTYTALGQRELAVEDDARKW